MSKSSPQVSQHALPTQRDGGGIVTTNVLSSSELRYSKVTLKSAGRQFVMQAVLLAALMFVCSEMMLRIIIMLEVFLVCLLGASELHRGRESSRRLTLILSMLNFIFVTIFAIFIGNMLLLIAGGVMTVALLIMIGPRVESSKGRIVSWAVLLLGFAALFNVAVFAQVKMNHAREAYIEGDYSKADKIMQQITPFLELRGGQDAERALILFRRAELAYREGRGEEAKELLERCDDLAKTLAVPPEYLMPAGGLRVTLAFKLVNVGIIDLYARIHALRAWGDAQEMNYDPLSGTIVTSADSITWAW